MKVLHVLDHSLPLQSGYSSRTYAILTFQRRLGLSPVVLTSPKHPSARDEVEELDAIRHYRTRLGAGAGAPRLARELLLMLRMLKRIAGVARSEQVRLIHAHSPSLNGLPALWAGRRLGLPVVYEARALWEDAAVDHGTFRNGSLGYRLSRALETWLLGRVDRVVTICEGLRRELIRRGIDGRRIAVVPNGVDIDRFRPVPPSLTLRRDLALDGDPVFGYVGSFYRYEGLSFFLEAFRAVRERLQKAQVLLVGGGNEEGTLRQLAKSLGDGVVFTGRVPLTRVREFYSLIDVFVCPRRRVRLTELVTPLKPLEAMAMGRPVLASDVGGLTELVRDGVTGILFPAESREGLVEGAIRLGSDARWRRSLGEAAREAVVRERSWDRIVARYPAVYEEAASERRGMASER